MIVALRSIHSCDETVTYRHGHWRSHVVDKRDHWVRAWQGEQMYVHRISGEVSIGDAARRALAVAPCRPEPVPAQVESRRFEDHVEDGSAVPPREILERLLSSHELSCSELLFVSSRVTRELVVGDAKLTHQQVVQSLAATVAGTDDGRRTVASFESVGRLRLHAIVDELLQEGASRARPRAAHATSESSTSDVIAFRDLRPLYRYIGNLLAAGSADALPGGPADDTGTTLVNLEDCATDCEGRWYRPFDDEGTVRLEPLPLIADGHVVRRLASRAGVAGSTGNGFLDSSGQIAISTKWLALRPGDKSEREVLETLPRAVVINAVAHVGLTMSGRVDLKVDNALIACRGEIVGTIPSLHIECQLSDLLGRDRVVAVSRPTETRRTPTLFVELPWRSSI